MESTKNIFVFKTNIHTLNDKLIVKEILGNHHQIEEWSVDLQDCDKVLRVVTPALTVNNIIELINESGYECRELE